jgi:nucleotide-binding universal stress UspA family protein
MFSHLLVPLDGSRMAESALPAAVFLARRLGAAVTLFHAIERDAPATIHGEPHLTSASQARSYLAEVAAHSFPPSSRVTTDVHVDRVDNVARSIVAHADELRAGLVVLCTHGSGGLRQLVFGSIAQQVLALGTTPVLLVQPAGPGTTPPFVCQRVLVPLDGDPEHAQAVSVARELARACEAAVHLVVVVATRRALSQEQAATAVLLPSATDVLLDLVQQQMQEYLSRQVAQLTAAGLAATSEVQRGDPVTSIIRAAQRAQADLIVLGTHGKTAPDAFWSGSITPRLARRTALPLLLVPVKERPSR